MPDIIELMGAPVLRQHPLQLQRCAEEIVHRVLVFASVEPSQHGSLLMGMLGEQGLAKVFADQGDFCRSWPVLYLGRRHLALVHPVKDLLPFGKIFRIRKIVCQFFQIQPALGRTVPMTIITVRGQYRLQL